MSHTNTLKFFALALAICGMAMPGNLSADVLVTENFTYADGDLTSNPLWTGHSGTGNLVQVSSGQASLTHGAGSREDANIGFAAPGGILGVTYAFDLIVNDDAPIVAGDPEYFAHFMTGGTGFVARLDISESATSDFSLGIGNSSTADAFTGDFSFGSTVAVLVGYDYVTGQASLTVGGTTISTTSAGTATALDQFALRQATSGSNESILVDNLVISSVVGVPEPGSMAVIGMLGLACVSRRRR